MSTGIPLDSESQVHLLGSTYIDPETQRYVKMWEWNPGQSTVNQANQTSITSQ